MNFKTRVMAPCTVFSGTSRTQISGNAMLKPQDFCKFSTKQSNDQACANLKCDGNTEEIPLELQVSNEEFSEFFFLSVKNRSIKSSVPNSNTNGLYMFNKKVLLEKNGFPPSNFPEIYIFGIRTQQYSDKARSSVLFKKPKTKNCAFCDEDPVAFSNKTKNLLCLEVSYSREDHLLTSKTLKSIKIPLKKR